jgi:hypothetical protein
LIPPSDPQAWRPLTRAERILRSRRTAISEARRPTSEDLASKLADTVIQEAGVSLRLIGHARNWCKPELAAALKKWLECVDRFEVRNGAKERLFAKRRGVKRRLSHEVETRIARNFYPAALAYLRDLDDGKLPRRDRERAVISGIERIARRALPPSHHHRIDHLPAAVADRAATRLVPHEWAAAFAEVLAGKSWKRLSEEYPQTS